jgi:hypothetical protein
MSSTIAFSAATSEILLTLLLVPLEFPVPEVIEDRGEYTLKIARRGLIGTRG